MSLADVRIVLVEPSHPGNIGGVARAMKNMGLRSLYLVAPTAFPDAEADARAAAATDVLASARVCTSLDEALEDCSLVIGTSARARTIAWPQLDPAACAHKLLAHSRTSSPALLFGRERTGLTNAELDRCHYVVEIPADPRFPSLNLACAVQVLAYELRVASLQVPADAEIQEDQAAPLASQEDLQRFYRHLEEVLIEIAFLNPAHPRKLMRRLMRLFNRAGLDQNELNILRGILTAVQQGRRHT